MNIGIHCFSNEQLLRVVGTQTVSRSDSNSTTSVRKFTVDDMFVAEMHYRHHKSRSHKACTSHVKSFQIEKKCNSNFLIDGRDLKPDGESLNKAGGDEESKMKEPQAPEEASSTY